MNHLPRFFLIAILSLVASTTFAQWSAEDDLAVCTKDTIQRTIAVIPDGYSGAWVIWLHKVESLGPRIDSNRHGLQHLNHNGYALLEENGITLNDSIQTIRIFGAYPTGDSGLTICYNGNIPSTNTYRSYLQHFSSRGDRAWNYQGKPVSSLPGNVLAIYPTGNGEAYIAIGCRGQSNTDEIYIQRVLRDGSYAFGDNGMLVYRGVGPLPTTHFQLFPRDESGVWFAIATLQGSTLVNGIDSSGTLSYEAPGIALEHSWANRYLVTSRRDSSSSGGFMFYSVIRSNAYDELRLHLINGAGVEVTPIEGRVLTDSSVQWLGTILPQTDGSVIFTYYGSYSTYTPLNMRCISADGTDCWETPLQFDRLDNTHTSAWITQDTSGILVTWDHGDTGRSIYAQLITVRGAKLWEENVHLESTHSDIRKTPIHTRDSRGNCILCWSDGRNETQTKEDIYCAKILASGSLVTIGDKFVSEYLRHPISSIAYPNPTKESITFRMRSDKTCLIRLSIFDKLGTVVYESDQLLCTKGDNSYEIQLGDVPVGTYYYTIRGNEVESKGQFIVIR